jgi:hypothetical protein
MRKKGRVMEHLERLVPYINSPTHFTISIVAVLLVWIVSERARR